MQYSYLNCGRKVKINSLNYYEYICQTQHDLYQQAVNNEYYDIGKTGYNFSSETCYQK